MSDETKLTLGFFLFIILLVNSGSCGGTSPSDCYKMCGTAPVRFVEGSRFDHKVAECICTESRLDGGMQ